MLYTRWPVRTLMICRKFQYWPIISEFHYTANNSISAATKSQYCTHFLPGGLSGVGLGLGPGGQPIDATSLNRGSGGGMGNMGPGGNLPQCVFLNSWIEDASEISGSLFLLLVGMDGMGFGNMGGRMGGGTFQNFASGWGSPLIYWDCRFCC